MIDSLGIQRAASDTSADEIPRYNERFVRQNAGLSREQTGEEDDDSLDPYLVNAIRAFQAHTSLRVYRHSYTYEFSAEPLRIDSSRPILLPGLACSLESFTCGGLAVPEAQYRALRHEGTGCISIKPALNQCWSFARDAAIRIEFSAGIAAADELPPEIQSILAVRIRFDVYEGAGDLMRYNEERRRYTIGTIIYG